MQISNIAVKRVAIFTATHTDLVFDLMATTRVMDTRWLQTASYLQ